MRPCKALVPIAERMAAENAGRIKVVRIDTDGSPKTAQRYGVRGVPTPLVFRGGEQRASHLGVPTKERVMRLIEGSFRPPGSPRPTHGVPTVVGA